MQLEPTETGFRDAGVARFGNDTCTMGGALNQSYSLDSRDVSGPVMVDVSWRARCAFPTCLGGIPALRFGTSFQTVTPDGDIFASPDLSAEFCLGDSGYGTDTTMELVGGVAPNANGCVEGNIEYLDHLEFRGATEAECPVPGTVFNGTFDEAGAPGTIPGWTLGTRGNYSVQVDNGDNALVMEPGMKCVGMSASTQVGIPAGPEAWALKYEGTLVDSARGTLSIGGVSFDAPVLISHRGDGSSFSNTVCLPRWMNGTYAQIGYTVGSQAGRCDETSNWRNVFDDLELVAAPDCGETGIIRDGDFDTTTTSPWIVDKYLYSGSILFLNEQGDRFVRMTGGECDTPSVQQSFIIPNDATAPNTFEFRYRHRGAPGTTAQILVSSGSTSEGNTLPDTGGDWETGSVCIPPTRLGYPIQLIAEMSSSGTCAPGNPVPVALDFDDVQLTTTAGCSP